MLNTGKFVGKTILITDAACGIGKEIGIKLAQDGANIVITAKSAVPIPKLPGTTYTTAQEIEKVGGHVLPCIVDVRDEESVEKCFKEAVKKFGGIDILVNHEPEISVVDTVIKNFDIIKNINTQGKFLMSEKAIPYLKKSSNAHILNISPPLKLNPEWFTTPHQSFTLAKYCTSLSVLGMAKKLRSDGIAINALWPKTMIWSAETDILTTKEIKASRYPTIMADAAYAILSRNSRETTGNFFIDEDVLKAEGITNFGKYAVDLKAEFDKHFFVPGTNCDALQDQQEQTKKDSEMGVQYRINTETDIISSFLASSEKRRKELAELEQEKAKRDAEMDIQDQRIKIEMKNNTASLLASIVKINKKQAERRKKQLNEKMLLTSILLTILTFQFIDNRKPSSQQNPLIIDENILEY